MTLYKNTNLHSHTYLCHHAEGSVSEYVEEAIRNGVEILGISDHTPFPETRDRHIRMELEDLPKYITEIEMAREKYSNITLFKGLECDYISEFIPFYKEMKEQYQIDYLIGSVHQIFENGHMLDVFEETLDHTRMKLYTEQMLANIDTNLFAFIAHPDLFCMKLEQWDTYIEDCVREMCRMAELKKVPLEINVNGQHKYGAPYPNERFWKIASEYQIETVVNSDAHRIRNLCDKKEIGYKIQEKYNLKQWSGFLDWC